MLIRNIGKKRIKKLTLRSIQSMRLQKMRILFVLSLLFISGHICSQVGNIDITVYDTIDYYIS